MFKWFKRKGCPKELLDKYVTPEFVRDTLKYKNVLEELQLETSIMLINNPDEIVISEHFKSLLPLFRAAWSKLRPIMEILQECDKDAKTMVDRYALLEERFKEMEVRHELNRKHTANQTKP